MKGPALVVLLFAGPLVAQELEPRALVNAPVGTNFVVASTGYLYGNLLLDPSLPVEGARADLWTLSGGYVRSIGLFGMAGRILIGLPFATGEWKGQVDDVDTSTSRTGMGDPVVKMSLNFLGSPALTRSQFRTYRQKTVAGVSFAVTLPLGQYSPERLINLGSNRWSFSPRFGVSRVLDHWIVEGYAGATFYTRNNEAYGGRTVSQAPLIDTQLHVIRFFGSPAWWAAGSAGYAWGGASTVNGVKKQSLDNKRLSLTMRAPTGKTSGLKLVYINGLSTRLGGDFDTIQLAWQYSFGGKP